MQLKQVSDNCFAVLNEKNRVCDANSGLINLAGGVVIDTQSDLAHARQMIEMFSKVWSSMPRRVINTHEDADHVWGNQLFKGAEIIAHRSVPERIKHVADPKETQKLLHGLGHWLTRLIVKKLHPGLAAVGQQLLEDYNFDGIELATPTTLFDTRYELDLDGTEVHLIYVGPCHQVGDIIIHVPKERVVFAGDVLFRQCTPIGWTGTYEKWFQCLDLMIELDPEVIVAGHGPLCGIEGPVEMRDYLEYVREESKKSFEEGLSSLSAAKRIELGPYAEWRAPARVYMNVERAYREFRREPSDAHWDPTVTFDAIFEVADSQRNRGRILKVRRLVMRRLPAIGIGLLLALLAPSLAAQSFQSWPEVDTYLKLNSNVRASFYAALTRENATGSSAEIGPNIDFFLKPLVKLKRITVFEIDQGKDRPLMFRLGYRYMPSTDGTVEHRGIAEATGRYPLIRGVLLSDRNRVEFRDLSGEFIWRYRNRLSAERTVAIHNYHFTPYLRAEAFYDEKVSKWSRTELTIGSTFPLSKHFEVEWYYTHQNDTAKPPNRQVDGMGYVFSMYF